MHILKKYLLGCQFELRKRAIRETKKKMVFYRVSFTTSIYNLITDYKISNFIPNEVPSCVVL